MTLSCTKLTLTRVIFDEYPTRIFFRLDGVTWYSSGDYGTLTELTCSAIGTFERMYQEWIKQ